MSENNPFAKYYLNERLSDVVIIVEGKRIPCHKFVLSDTSPVFETMFSSHFKESNDKEFQIKETSFEAFRVMLQFMYKQEFVMKDQTNYLFALEVIQLSHRFQIKSLVHLIEDKLIKMIEIKSFMDLWKTSKLLDLKKLINALEEFICKNDFYKYYLSETLSDITLIIDGNCIPAHQFLLWAKFPLFAEMISRSAEKSNNKNVEIKDVSIEALKVILWFIYHNDNENFVIEDENYSNYELAIEVLKLSHRFQFKHLFQCMERILRGNPITIHNFLHIFQCYQLYGLDSMLIKLKKFVRENSNQLIDFISFVGLSTHTINCFLSLFKSQTPVINVLNKMKAESPQKDLKQFKKSIKFKFCSLKDMRALKDLNLFTEKQFNKIWDRKYEKLLNENEILKIEIQNLNEEYLQNRNKKNYFRYKNFDRHNFFSPQVVSNNLYEREDSDYSDSGLYYSSESDD